MYNYRYHSCPCVDSVMSNSRISLMCVYNFVLSDYNIDTFVITNYCIAKSKQQHQNNFTST